MLEYISKKRLRQYARKCVKFIRRGTNGVVVLNPEELLLNAELNIDKETDLGYYLPKGWQAVIQAMATDMMVEESKVG